MVGKVSIVVLYIIIKNYGMGFRVKVGNLKGQMVEIEESTRKGMKKRKKEEVRFLNIFIR